MLSHHERQELERIQHWFELDDPEFARALGEGAPPKGTWRSRLARFGMDAFALSLVVLGAVTLNFGVIFFGAVMLAVAACMHVTRHGEGPASGGGPAWHRRFD